MTIKMSLLDVLACDWQQWTVYMDCQGTVTVCGLTVIEEIYMNVLSSVLHALAAVYIYNTFARVMDTTFTIISYI